MASGDESWVVDIGYNPETKQLWSQWTLLAVHHPLSSEVKVEANASSFVAEYGHIATMPLATNLQLLRTATLLNVYHKCWLLLLSAD